MTLWLWLYGASVLCMCVVIAGLTNAYFQNSWPTLNKDPIERKKCLGLALLVSVFFGTVWPLGLPIAFCLTGFAHHGWSLALDARTKETR